MRKISLYLLVIFYVLAGLNHFRAPEFYYPLIPPYLPFPKTINIVSGILEVVLGLAILHKSYRNDAAHALILLLILFIPSHIYFIQIGGCIESGLCIPLWVAWFRLILIHPLLIGWIWKHRKD